MKKHILSDLCCPASMIQFKVKNLKIIKNSLKSSQYKYPIIDGVPDLRIYNDRKETPYDNILENIPRNSHSNAIDGLIKSMSIKREHILDKKVLIAGVAGGFDLDIILSFKPKIVYALDFSNFVISLSKDTYYENKKVFFIIGDLCNLPFKPNTFDYVINNGVMQHTRAPELAHRNISICLKRGGFINYGNLNLDNLHNTRVSIDRLKNKYHKMDTTVAKKKLKTYSKFYYLFIKYKLLNLINRKSFRFFSLLELSGKKSQSKEYYFYNALNYYLVSHRHLLNESEIINWFKRTNFSVKRTEKGFLGEKIK